MDRARKSKSRGKIILGCIIVLAIVSGIIYGLQPKYPAEDLFALYYQTPAYKDNTYWQKRSVLTNEREAQIEQALILYTQRDYKLALSAFTVATQNVELNDLPSDIIFYSAICMIEADEKPHAIDYFRYLTLKKNLYRDEAEWYLAILYIDNNQRDEAKPLLDRIILKQSLHTANASELLSKLDDRKWFGSSNSRFVYK